MSDQPADDAGSDRPPRDAFDFPDPFEDLTPHEELLVRLFTSGQTAHSRSELATDIDCEPDTLEETLDTLSTAYVLLTDGDDTDPQYTVNPLLNLMGELTRLHTLLGEGELESRITEYETRIASYREATGVETPDEYLAGLRSGDIEPLGLDQINEPYWEAHAWHAEAHHLEMLRLYERWRPVVTDWVADVPFDPVDPFERD